MPNGCLWLCAIVTIDLWILNAISCILDGYGFSLTWLILAVIVDEWFRMNYSANVITINVVLWMSIDVELCQVIMLNIPIWIFMGDGLY